MAARVLSHWRMTGFATHTAWGCPKAAAVRGREGTHPLAHDGLCHSQGVGLPQGWSGALDGIRTASPDAHASGNSLPLRVRRYNVPRDGTALSQALMRSAAARGGGRKACTRRVL